MVREPAPHLLFHMLLALVVVVSPVHRLEFCVVVSRVLVVPLLVVYGGVAVVVWCWWRLSNCRQ